MIKNFFKDFKLGKEFIGFFAIVFYVIASVTGSIISSGLNDLGVPRYIVNGTHNVFSLMLVITLGYFFKDLIIKSYKDIKKNHLKHFKKYFVFWFYMLGLMMISNLLIAFINGGELPQNEAMIRELFNASPIYIYVAAVLIAPFLEELVFRAGLYYIIKNKYIFILASGLAFGAIHVLPSLESSLELLYIIPYSIPGFVFAYTLYDSKNIFVPMGLHFVHNGVLMALQTIIFMFS